MNTKPEICLKSFYSDDPDGEKSGQGLAFVPVLGEELSQISTLDWLMSPAEQIGVIYLLERLKPRVSIEIGTRYGGSLQVLAKLSEKVYSLDLDPDVPRRLAGKFANVEYITGSSRTTLPPLVEQLQKANEPVSFVLIDGDHSAEGVRCDIDSILQFRPVTPLFIIMHDSYNPECRKGITSANWAGNPYVHSVELDFISGCLNPARAWRGELWGGLGLAVLLPEKRSGRFEVTGRGNLTVQTLRPLHNARLLLKQAHGFLAHRWNKKSSRETSS
ncbi:MAG: class I SAM-dependent methyltransferase [Verrucomicrobia bacterium]|nr:class I SAM-dependent methyltransferase [Verrucomicrobiota bacterium]